MLVTVGPVQECMRATIRTAVHFAHNKSIDPRDLVFIFLLYTLIYSYYNVYRVD